MELKKVAVKIKKIYDKFINGNSSRFYDMSDKVSREQTVEDDYSFAVTERQSRQAVWVENDNYYNNKHKTSLEIAAFLKEQGIPFTPAVVPDAFIHVEAQIIADIPGFQFNGRDDDMDSNKAKQREAVVQYVLDNNKANALNTKNERKLGITGNAFWKVSFDNSITGYGYQGDIVLGTPGVENIFPDPSAFELQDCEYLIYAYRIHKRKAVRIFERELEKVYEGLKPFGSDGKNSDTEIYRNQVRDTNDDTTQVLEYWFKQPNAGTETIDGVVFEWVAGDIACSIQIDNNEIKYIPKYWVKTGNQNKLYPFVKYCKIPSCNNFWDKSDIEAFKELQDQVDREVSMMILNDTFMSNDIIVREEHALAEGYEFKNTPGAELVVKDGMINSVRRLGGTMNVNGRMEVIQFLRSMIQEVVGNFDTSNGKEPVRVTTASGIAQLNERADKRGNIKKADRTAGFGALYELIDWSALEFLDQDRMIFIGAVKDNEEPTVFPYNSDNLRVFDDKTGKYYFPKIDAEINISDGLSKSKAFTLATTENLVSRPINASNYKIVNEMLDIMDSPNKKDIKAYYESLYALENEVKNATLQQQLDMIQNPQPTQSTQPQQPTQPTQEEYTQNIMNGLSPEELQHIQDNPNLMEQIQQIIHGG